MNPIIFFVHGEPIAQPRPRGYAVFIGGKWTARMYNPDTADEWKDTIVIAAKPFLPPTPIDGPVWLGLEFYMPRPLSHFRTGRFAGELKPDAPKRPHGLPDRDNLEKAVMDALTQVGFWRNDAQVCDGPVKKFYAGAGMKPCCMVTIQEI